MNWSIVLRAFAAFSRSWCNGGWIIDAVGALESCQSNVNTHQRWRVGIGINNSHHRQHSTPSPITEEHLPDFAVGDIGVIRYLGIKLPWYMRIRLIYHSHRFPLLGLGATRFRGFICTNELDFLFGLVQNLFSIYKWYFKIWT